ncbi:hypothetical protein [Bradyrhizobium sp. Gha]|uniref:hypothetical protein n=1 Tax=Bradyrhizobium sp. Gha TaxID=1855318 RepID=UPI0008E5BD8A|nr:hypothetical protein [Bradyrhizobium sp. Gha]SFI35029.1 hypothetical protein SAMN05216525_107221 [Bradyrhizobium sp. Gha]
MDARASWSSSRPDGSSGTIPSRPTFGTYAFLITFACAFYLSNAPLLLGHYDLGWHLAAGDLIRAHAAIPFQDPWSFTLGDKQWFNLSWLWDVIASRLVQSTGLTGLVLLVVACGGMIVGCLASACLGRGASAISVCIAVFAAGLLYPAYEAAPNIYLAASPNVATMLFCVVFYRVCLAGTKWLLLLPAMMVLWVNLHGGFLIGFLVIGVFCGTAVLQQDWPRCKGYGLAGLGCAAAVLVNPLGWRIHDGVTATMGHFVQANIGEWLPYSHNVEMPGSIPGMIYMATFVALEVYRGRQTPIPLQSRLLAWLFLLLGFYQFRYMSFFFLFSALPLALHIDQLLPGSPPAREIQKSLLIAGLTGALALPMIFLHVAPELELPQMVSEQDADYLKAHLPHARLLNHWNAGGLLIYYTRGAVPLFVDGRAATAYPDDLLRDYFKLVREDIDETAWDTIIDKYRIDAVLWVKDHKQLRQFLVERRGWREDYAGQYESVYVKP